MASYRVLIKRSAVKELEAVSLKDRRRLVARIEGLAATPRPVGVQKLSGEEKYRLRQGDYRILYEIVDEDLIVTVVRVGHRREGLPVDREDTGPPRWFVRHRELRTARRNRPPSLLDRALARIQGSGTSAMSSARVNGFPPRRTLATDAASCEVGQLADGAVEPGDIGQSGRSSTPTVVRKRPISDDKFAPPVSQDQPNLRSACHLSRPQRLWSIRLKRLGGSGESWTWSDELHLPLLAGGSSQREPRRCRGLRREHAHEAACVSEGLHSGKRVGRHQLHEIAGRANHEFSLDWKPAEELGPQGRLAHRLTHNERTCGTRPWVSCRLTRSQSTPDSEVCFHRPVGREGADLPCWGG